MDLNDRRESFRSGVIDLISGSLGGIAIVYVGQPLDTVKVKMQTFPTLYKGMTDCFLRTFKTDGLARGLYAGTVPAIVANVAENSVLFAAYGGCQRAIASTLGITRIDDLSSIQNAWAGFFAAFFSSLTLCPTELIKCKLQAMREVENGRKVSLGTNTCLSAATTTIASSTSPKFATTANASAGVTPTPPPTRKSTPMMSVSPWILTKQILRDHGIGGLFRGLSSTIAREMPGYFFFFGGYEVTRELLTLPGQSKDDIGWKKTMLAGAVGGTLLWLVIFPADVIKSRIQVQNLKTPALLVLKDIVRNEGLGALYNGLKPTLIRTAPATAALFVTYEYSKKFLHNLCEGSQENKYTTC